MIRSIDLEGLEKANSTINKRNKVRKTKNFSGTNFIDRFFGICAKGKYTKNKVKDSDPNPPPKREQIFPKKEKGKKETDDIYGNLGGNGDDEKEGIGHWIDSGWPNLDPQTGQRIGWINLDTGKWEDAYGNQLKFKDNDPNKDIIDENGNTLYKAPEGGVNSKNMKTKKQRNAERRKALSND